MIDTYTNQTMPNEHVTLQHGRNLHGDTNAIGVAACSVTVNEPQGVSTAGRSGDSDHHAPAQPHGFNTFTVTQAPTNFAYTGATS